MKLLFLDFETQSDDAKTTHPTEVGAALVHVGEGQGPDRVFTREKTLSSLIYDAAHYKPQTPEIVEITGITDEMLKAEGRDPATVFGELFPLIMDADYVLAHNAKFDQGVYNTTVSRLCLPVVMPKKGWLCTLQDIPWPLKYKCKKLSHLAYDHGILVDPRTLHRALDDVALLERLVLCGSGFQIEDIIAHRNTPSVYLRAVVKPPWEDAGVETGQAKKLGFTWERAFGDERVFPKMWVKKIKIPQLAAEKARCPFRTTELVDATQGDVL